MAQEPIKIKEHIDAERERLGQDIEEIEHRMKDAFDWRSWYESNTAVMLGAAAAGGFLVSVLLDRGSNGATSPDYNATTGTMQTFTSRTQNSQLSRIGDLLENTFAALIGVGASKFQDYVSEVIP